MSERFERIFSLPEYLCVDGTPVVIAAGALLKDITTGKILVQLKFESISSMQIDGIKVKIIPFDTFGNQLGNEVQYEYSDLKANRDENFGQKKVIPLANPLTRSFSVEVTDVLFSNNSIWHSDGNAWTPSLELIKIPLEQSLGNPELARQYRIEFGQDSQYMPNNTGSLWLCTCGAINNAKELTCHVCGRDAQILTSDDLVDLKNSASNRIRQDTDRAKVRERKTAKVIIISIVAFVITSILLSVLVIIPSVKQQSIEQNRQKIESFCEDSLDKSMTAYLSALSSGNAAGGLVVALMDETELLSNRQITYEKEELDGNNFLYEGKAEYNCTVTEFNSEIVISLTFRAKGNLKDETQEFSIVDADIEMN